MTKLLTPADLARRYDCTRRTVLTAVIHRQGFPKAIMPTGSPRLRVWDEAEVVAWERSQGRRAA